MFVAGPTRPTAMAHARAHAHPHTHHTRTPTLTPHPPCLCAPARLQGLTRLFAERKEVWAAAVDCTAQLDALMSLAVAAACSGGPMCRPNLVAWSEAGAAPGAWGSCGVAAGRGAHFWGAVQLVRHRAGPSLMRQPAHWHTVAAVALKSSHSLCPDFRHNPTTGQRPVAPKPAPLHSRQLQCCPVARCARPCRWWLAHLPGQGAAAPGRAGRQRRRVCAQRRAAGG